MLKKQISVELFAVESLQENYDLFASAVETLRAQLQVSNDRGESRKHHPDFLGYGQSAEVYVINVNGRQYACRFADIYTHDSNMYKSFDGKVWTSFEAHVTGLVRMQNTPGFMQFYAVSLAERVTITNIMLGQTIKDWHNSAELLNFEIPDEHINAFFEWLELAQQRNVVLDMQKPDNTFYDRETGFSLVDYTVYVPDLHRPETFEQLLIKTCKIFLPAEDSVAYACFEKFIKRCEFIYTSRYGAELNIWEQVRKLRQKDLMAMFD